MASAHVKQLQMKLAELDAQLAEINVKRSIILEMIEDESPTPKKERAPRANVKSLVLGMLSDVGPKGLNAAIVVDAAKDGGRLVERGSVSSLLSRLKHDGTVTYDEDGRYRLTSAPRPTKPTLSGGSVSPLRTSGVFQ